MTSRFYRLPSLNALATFEAAARNRSFKNAAIELNVTNGAVSRQIKALEDEVGVSLFHRTPAGLVLTAQGRHLHSVLSNLFRLTGEALDAIRTDQPQRQVTIASTHTIAKYWLMPRMGEFLEHHPDICLNHYIFDDTQELQRSDVDLRIRFGSGAWPQENAVELFDDMLYPVASPRFVELHPNCDVADLLKLPLLHVDWVDADWTNWDTMLSFGGVGPASMGGRRFGNMEIALHACRDGQGVAIGWHRLVCDAIAAGDLVRFTSLTMPSTGRYHLTWSTNNQLTPAACAVRDWFLEKAAADRVTPIATA